MRDEAARNPRVEHDRYAAGRVQCVLAARHAADDETLQDLGFLYHIDDVSRDEPFTVTVRGRPFAVVPYTLRNNDIVPL